MKLSQLKPNPKNPRTISEDQMEKLKKSIRKLLEQRKTITRKQEEVDRLRSLLKGARQKIDELSK